MKSLHIITLVLLTFVASVSFAKCADFILHNHTGHILVLDTGNKDSLCQDKKFPRFIAKNATAHLWIKQADATKGSEMNLVTSHPVYVSVKSFNLGKKYNLFEEFLIDNHGNHIINEELISKDSAYSWEHANRDIHFCTAKQMREHNTCRL